MILHIIEAVSVLISIGFCFGFDAFGSLRWLWMLPVVLIASFFVLLISTFLVLCIIISPIDPHAPSVDDPRYRKLGAYVIEAIFMLLQTKTHTVGFEKVPGDTRFMLVCNHLSVLDPLLLFHFFRDSHLAFISKRENADMFFIGKLMQKLLTQTINRENDREALKTILNCIRIIKEDRASIAVFPEGYTSKDGLLHHFRAGVFKIAQKAGVPIVVCTVQNTKKIFHNAARLHHTDVQLHLVGVIPAEELRGITSVEIADRVHGMMAADLGPDLVAEE